MENWKEIKEFPNYEVSDLGRVRYNFNGRVKIRVLRKTTNGYLKVNLSFGKLIKTISIHRLVAKTFFENCDENLQVNHKDGIKTNNKIENLEFVTQHQNAKHAWDMGLCEKNVRYQLATPVVDKQTGIFYPSIKDACFYTNLDYRTQRRYFYKKKHLSKFI